MESKFTTIFAITFSAVFLLTAIPSAMETFTPEKGEWRISFGD
jgi:hypothetical protein